MLFNINIICCIKLRLRYREINNNNNNNIDFILCKLLPLL